MGGKQLSSTGGGYQEAEVKVYPPISSSADSAASAGATAGSTAGGGIEGPNGEAKGESKSPNKDEEPEPEPVGEWGAVDIEVAGYGTPRGRVDHIVCMIDGACMQVRV